MTHEIGLEHGLEHIEEDEDSEEQEEGLEPLDSPFSLPPPPLESPESLPPSDSDDGFGQQDDHEDLDGATSEDEDEDHDQFDAADGSEYFTKSHAHADLLRQIPPPPPSVPPPPDLALRNFVPPAPPSSLSPSLSSSPQTLQHKRQIQIENHLHQQGTQQQRSAIKSVGAMRRPRPPPPAASLPPTPPPPPPSAAYPHSPPPSASKWVPPPAPSSPPPVRRLITNTPNSQHELFSPGYGTVNSGSSSSAHSGRDSPRSHPSALSSASSTSPSPTLPSSFNMLRPPTPPNANGTVKISGAGRLPPGIELPSELPRVPRSEASREEFSRFQPPLPPPPPEESLLREMELVAAEPPPPPRAASPWSTASTPSAGKRKSLTVRELQRPNLTLTGENSSTAFSTKLHAADNFQTRARAGAYASSIRDSPVHRDMESIEELPSPPPTPSDEELSPPALPSDVDIASGSPASVTTPPSAPSSTSVLSHDAPSSILEPPLSTPSSNFAERGNKSSTNDKGAGVSAMSDRRGVYVLPKANSPPSSESDHGDSALHSDNNTSMSSSSSTPLPPPTPSETHPGTPISSFTTPSPPLLDVDEDISLEVSLPSSSESMDNIPPPPLGERSGDTPLSITRTEKSLSTPELSFPPPPSSSPSPSPKEEEEESLSAQSTIEAHGKSESTNPLPSVHLPPPPLNEESPSAESPKRSMPPANILASKTESHKHNPSFKPSVAHGQNDGEDSSSVEENLSLPMDTTAPPIFFQGITTQFKDPVQTPLQLSKVNTVKSKSNFQDNANTDDEALPPIARHKDNAEDFHDLPPPPTDDDEASVELAPPPINPQEKVEIPTSKQDLASPLQSSNIDLPFPLSGASDIQLEKDRVELQKKPNADLGDHQQQLQRENNTIQSVKVELLSSSLPQHSRTPIESALGSVRSDYSRKNLKGLDSFDLPIPPSPPSASSSSPSTSGSAKNAPSAKDPQLTSGWNIDEPVATMEVNMESQRTTRRSSSPAVPVHLASINEANSESSDSDDMQDRPTKTLRAEPGTPVLAELPQSPLEDNYPKKQYSPPSSGSNPTSLSDSSPEGYDNNTGHSSDSANFELTPPPYAPPSLAKDLRTVLPYPPVDVPPPTMAGIDFDLPPPPDIDESMDDGSVSLYPEAPEDDPPEESESPRNPPPLDLPPGEAQSQLSPPSHSPPSSSSTPQSLSPSSLESSRLEQQLQSDKHGAYRKRRGINIQRRPSHRDVRPPIQRPKHGRKHVNNPPGHSILGSNPQPSKGPISTLDRLVIWRQRDAADTSSESSSGSWLNYVHPPPYPPQDASRYESFASAGLRKPRAASQDQLENLESVVDDIIARRRARKGTNTLLLPRNPEMRTKQKQPVIASSAEAVAAAKAATPGANGDADPEATLHKAADRVRAKTVRLAHRAWASFWDVKSSPRQQMVWEYLNSQQNQDTLDEGKTRVEDTPEFELAWQAIERPHPMQSLEVFGSSGTLCEINGIRGTIHDILRPLLTGVSVKVRMNGSGNPWEVCTMWVNTTLENLCWARRDAVALKRQRLMLLSTCSARLKSIECLEAGSPGNPMKIKAKQFTLRFGKRLASEKYLRVEFAPLNEELLEAEDEWKVALALVWNLAASR